jgi:hypothetical protein
VDSLLQLIDNRIQKALSNSSCVNSQVGQVISVGENKCDVKLFTSGVTYSIPNFSGSDVYENQMVYVYWRGGFLSNQTAYIGAALTQGGKMNYIIGSENLGELSETDSVVSSMTFSVQSPTVATLNFNAVLENELSGTVNFTIVLDTETTMSYTPKFTAAVGFNHCSFAIMIPLETVGDHKVEVKANGTGEIIQIESFLTGQAILL